ncbi:MAG: hypothetical protein J2P43_12795, partial [Candidatus Dormibacteraeota bacterium]|nr:hypothetical protein [Candidatus Dormibacteraeota bacterium]
MAESAGRAEPARPGHERPEEHEGLSATFHEKAIRLRTMQLRLLLPSAVAIAIVVAGALLFALRDLPWPELGAGRNFQTGQLQTVPLPVGIFGGLALIVAWSFILTGALHAHVLFRVGGVVAYLFNGVTVFLAAIGTAPTLLSLPFVLASVVVAATALYLADRSNHRQAPHLHHRFRLRIPTFAWVFGVTALLYGLGALGGLRQGDVAFFLTAQLILLEIVLIPVLFLAGTDFAEWSEVVSGRVGSLLMRLPGWTLGAALVGAAVATLLWAAVLEGGPHRPDLAPIALQSAPVLILLIPVGLIGWLAQRRPTSTRVPFWALVLGVLTFFVPLAGASVVEAHSGSLPKLPTGTPALVVYEHVDPAYSVSVPEGWTRAEVPGGIAWTGNAPAGGASRLLVLSAGETQSPGATTVERVGARALGRPVRLGTRSQAGAWGRWEVETTPGGNAETGVAFLRQEGARAWILIGLSPPGIDREALWDAVRETWSPGPPAPVELPLPSLGVALPWIATGLSLMFGAGLMLLLIGRGEIATAGLFLLV